MISIIICSRTSEVADTFDSNIKATIGTEFEFVVIDNHDNRHSIFSAYNEGVKRAQGDILCFMHEDVTMHTANWGIKVCQYMSDNTIGILSVVGSHIIPAAGDWRVGYTDHHVLSFIQRVPTFGAKPKYFTKLTKDGIKGHLTDVGAVDGVWFCIRKNYFDEGKLWFDEKNFDSFHIYDLDISMQMNTLNKRLVICDDILLEHFSEGNYSTGFFDALQVFQNKWQGKLPIIRGTNIDASAISAKGENAVNLLKQRIARDADVVLIRKYWNDKAAGIDTGELTEAQKHIIAFSEFFYLKTAIKFYPSASHLKQLMHEYIKDDMMIEKKLLMWKYFIYRVLHIPHSKTTVKFP